MGTNYLPIPRYLTPVNELCQFLKVISVEEKLTPDGEVKISHAFGDLPGFSVRCIYIRSRREEELPDGTSTVFCDTDEVNVTLWSRKKPRLKVGDWVIFPDIMVGAVDGILYYQATSFRKFDDEDSSSSVSLDIEESSTGVAGQDE